MNALVLIGIAAIVVLLLILVLTLVLVLLPRARARDQADDRQQPDVVRHGAADGPNDQGPWR